jgi:hypothetical protein
MESQVGNEKWKVNTDKETSKIFRSYKGLELTYVLPSTTATTKTTTTTTATAITITKIFSFYKQTLEQCKI